MKVEVTTRVTYTLDDLRKILTFTDDRGKKRDIPEDADLYLEEGNIVAQIVLQADPAKASKPAPKTQEARSQGDRARELQAKIRVVSRKKHIQRTKGAYEEDQLKRDLGVGANANAGYGVQIFAAMVTVEYPMSYKEIKAMLPVAVNETGGRRGLALLCAANAAEEIKVSVAAQMREYAGVGTRNHGSKYWMVTDKYLVWPVPEEVVEVSDES